MLHKLRQMFSGERPPAAVPPGERVYAVGDIHGRLDLFDQLIGAIEADEQARGAAETTVVLLGDLVDRGPDSAGVLARARQWAQARAVRMIQGNHEEMFLAAFAQAEALRAFLTYGGRETLLSYPAGRAALATMSQAELQAALPAIVPAADLALIAAMEDRIVIGDYLFVHAGIRPGVPIEAQTAADLRWIRRAFLEDSRDHGKVVVHGHTITNAVEHKPNRIGIDTGAFMTGRLTALGLEGTARWLLQTGGD